VESPSWSDSQTTGAHDRRPCATRTYLAAIAEGQGWGLLEVAAWSTWLLRRPIPKGGADAAGAYPRASILPGADLSAGLEELRALGLVSAVLVPDPLVSPDPARLAAAFELCQPFKTHQLIDRAKGFAPTKHHRDEIRRGERRCEVREVSLTERMDDWRDLYAELVRRHGIVGVSSFPDPYFPMLAGSPAFVAFAAFVQGAVAGMTIWYEHAGVAVSHLMAANALGYRNSATYALNAAAIERFSGAAVIDLGGGAGLGDDATDGLAQFKHGFSNAQTTAWLCGAVLDGPRYAALTDGRAATGFFPAYRG
jgi:hypothetical protein